MKKLGVTLLAAAFALPIFAGTQAASSTPAPQTQTQKKTTVKSHRRHHVRKNTAKTNKPAQPAPTK